MQRQLILFVALVLPATARSQAADPVAVVAQFHRALAEGDSSAALALLLPEVVIFEAGSVEASRDEYRQHHLPADMAFSRATAREVGRVRVDSVDHAAWVLTEARTTGTFRERPVDTRGVETIVLRRTVAGWRIAHIHWSSRRG